MQTTRRMYQSQKLSASKRNIEWCFTYESWLDWWGDDIINRGCRKGQLVMARHNDVGPYHPNNVRKATSSENNSESSVRKANSPDNALVRNMVVCPHCNIMTNLGNAKRWHLDNCKEMK